MNFQGGYYTDILNEYLAKKIVFAYKMCRIMKNKSQRIVTQCKKLDLLMEHQRISGSKFGSIQIDHFWDDISEGLHYQFTWWSEETPAEKK